jgi:hypothetical protein
MGLKLLLLPARITDEDAGRIAKARAAKWSDFRGGPDKVALQFGRRVGEEGAGLGGTARTESSVYLYTGTGVGALGVEALGRWNSTQRNRGTE